MKKSNGFTLIEVVVVVAVLSIMLAGMFSIFNTGVKMYAKDNTQVANQETIRTVMNSIEKKIRKADYPNAPFVSVGGCLQIWSKKSTTPSSYCQSGSTVTLNGSPILDRVKEFIFNIKTSTSVDNEYSVTITITSIKDSMGQENSLTETYSARRGR